VKTAARIATLALGLTAAWPIAARAQDHAADTVYPPEQMEAAREKLAEEHGGALLGTAMVNIAEYQLRSKNNGFRWQGEGRFGGDVNRLAVKSEGELTVGDDVDDAEIQALYSRALSPYFDVQAGLRYDVEPHPSRPYAAIGFEGLAPYWFDVDSALFVSTHGDVFARLEGSYDQLLTQRLIAQPRAEINLAAQDVREHELAAGITHFELELRVRYEICRELAPYLGVSWQRKVGQTAGFARREGDRVSSTSLVLGLRTWF
jgi:copper resistance protein B